jgi:hypothetical protein
VKKIKEAKKELKVVNKKHDSIDEKIQAHKKEAVDKIRSDQAHEQAINDHMEAKENEALDEHTIEL